MLAYNQTDGKPKAISNRYRISVIAINSMGDSKESERRLNAKLNKSSILVMDTSQKREEVG